MKPFVVNRYGRIVFPYNFFPALDFNVFETLEQSDESTRIASNWVRDEKLETALPNAPKITGGEVIVKKMVEKELVSA